jgi:asparagine synthase (glutamine-hydrolysing)
MCGIAGFQGDYTPQLVDAMVASIAHRGPDGEGVERFFGAGYAPTALGHRRLAIIDLSDNGLQPMSSGTDDDRRKSAGVWLVFNGEIYNFQELRQSLVRDGLKFRTATDTEVLLRLYERDGFDMLRKLNGIFAFAIHDCRPKNRPDGMPYGGLFLARDQLGVKPLYFAETAAGFLFGSEMKALRCSDDLALHVDPIALHQMLGLLWTPAPRTMLAAVKKVRPGEAVVVENGKIKRIWSYYIPPYDGQCIGSTFDEAAVNLAESVFEAVDRQLVADVPIGAYLSGGLDSSAIVAMMRKARPKTEIECFTIGLKCPEDSGDQVEDLPFARRVAKHLGVNLHEVPVDPDEIRALAQMIAMLDEPQADPAPINATLIARKASEMGIPVLMSGAGGDDIFTGYRRHFALMSEHYWQWMPVGMRALLRQGSAKLSRVSKTNITRRIAKLFAHADQESSNRLASYFVWSPESLRRALYSESFGERVENSLAIDPLMASLLEIPEENDRLQQMLYLETRHFLADHNLNYTDRAGMSVGVEVRVPLIDPRIVELATKLPPQFKQRGNVGKAVFKKAMEPFLPRDVIYRPKTGFGVPLRQWLRNELSDLVTETLSHDTINTRGFFDPKAVDNLIAADRNKSIDGSYTIFALMSFELWCRNVLDG